MERNRRLHCRYTAGWWKTTTVAFVQPLAQPKQSGSVIPVTITVMIMMVIIIIILIIVIIIIIII